MGKTSPDPSSAECRTGKGSGTETPAAAGPALDEIPVKVRATLIAYRDANWAAHAHYNRKRIAASRGDEAGLALLEKATEELRFAQDRTRVAHDEAVRAWV